MKPARNHYPEHLHATLAAPTKAAKSKKKKDPQPDYCLTCRVPVGKCKGNCTKEQQKINGGI